MPIKKKIIIYIPRLWTKALHEAKERWIVAVCHRRCGKTVASLNHLIRDAMKIKRSKYAYIAPLYKQAKNVAWDLVKEYLSKVDGVKFNEAELRADLKNGSRITLYGADNPDSLRGIGLWGCVFDEYSQQPANIFTEIIRPALADHKGYAIWIGTPKGKNDFYRLFEHAKKTENWKGIKLSVEDTGLIDDEELHDASKIMTSEEFAQEWYCSFEAAMKGAYYTTQITQARKDNRIRQIPHDDSLKVHTVWDLGVSDSTAIGFYQRVANEVRKIDYYENSGEGMPHYAKILQEKGYIYGKHFAPHDIKVREFGTGESRINTAKKLGINFIIVPNQAVADGINAGRQFWNKLWVDEQKCQLWLDAIALYRREWDEKKGMFRDTPLHDWTSHAADEFRYASLCYEQMNNSKEKKEYKPMEKW